MRLLFYENLSTPGKYSYPYRVYAQLDGVLAKTAGKYRIDESEADDVYSKGFLPSRIDPGLYYLARSVRVDLNKFKLSSENRRILRKNVELNTEICSLKNFEYNYDIGKFAKKYFHDRLGRTLITPSKMKRLFTEGFFTDVAIYTIDQKIVGYCLCNQTSNLLNYVYPFYDTNLMSQNLGVGMMTKAVVTAKELGKEYIYLGTCYEESAFYKLQFLGVQFFDGGGWCNDVKFLKEVVRSGSSVKKQLKEIVNSTLVI